MSPVEHELLTHAAALRRLARDLVGSDDADDLVQETALRALRSPPLLAGGLGGLLATILRRLAGTHRRDRRRRLRREQAAARLERVPAADQPVEHGEMLQRLTAAVMALPQLYRDALLQRYFEGQRPAAIARRLDVPVATVKTRLQRGLQKLREQLDADGERSDWRGALAGAFGMEQLATGLTGVLLMGTGTKLMIVGAASLLALAVFFTWPTEPGAALQRAATGAGIAEPIVAASSAAHPTPDAEPARREVAAGGSESLEVRAKVRGRCVDAVTKAPLPGCRVSLDAFEGGQSKAPPAAEITTGADGRVEFTFAPLAGCSITAEFHAEGRLRREAELGEVTGGRTIDLGDVEMLAGARVQGRVVATTGEPIPECVVSLENLPIRLRDTGGARIDASAGADGVFTFKDVVPPGVWQTEVSRTGWVKVAPSHITVPVGATTFEFAVTCAATPSISGSVVDESGKPIAKAEVRPVLGPSGRFTSARSKADGSFELFALETDPQPEPLEIYKADGFELPPRTEAIAWGTRDVRFVLQRGVSIDVEVVERASQRPVEEFAVTAPKENGPFPSRQWPMARRTDGRITLDGLERGKHIVAVLPDDPMVLPEQVLVDVQQGLRPVRIELERMTPQRVIARDGDGQPVAGAVVEVRHLAMAPELEWRAFDFRRQWPRVNQFRPREGPGAVLYCKAETDAQGETTVGIPGNDDALGIRATCRGRAPLFVRKPTLTPGQPLILTLAAAAALQGRVRVAGYTGRTYLVLSDLASEVRSRVDVAADGSFRVEDLEPGPRLLRLGLELRGTNRPLDPPLQRVVLRAGETTEVEVDASRFDAGTIKGIVLRDGQRLAGAKVVVAVTRTDTNGSFSAGIGPFLTDDRGEFTALGMVPGNCSVGIQIENRGQEIWLAHGDQVVVPAGGVVEREFHFVRHRLKVRVLDSQGKPLADRSVWAALPTPPDRTAKTDAEGVAEFDWMPSGNITLSPRWTPGFGHPAEGNRVEIPAAQTETTVELRWN